MREIKFRGKVLYNGNHYFSGDWVKGFYLENRKGDSFIIDTEPDKFGNASFSEVQVDPETVGEYLDAKDSDKKEIFEGDILEYRYTNSPSQKGVVRYSKHQTGFSAYPLKDSDGFQKSINFGGSVVIGVYIVGDIYEEPKCTPEG